MPNAEPHWVDRMIEDTTQTILMGLDHTLSHAPERILLAKGALERLTSAVRRWAMPKSELLAKLQTDIDAELAKRLSLVTSAIAECNSDIRGEQSEARRHMHREQSAAWAEQALVWSLAREVVQQAFNKDNNE